MIQTIPTSGNTQAERFAAELVRIRPDVTAMDRKDAGEKLKFTKATVSRYLNGHVLDTDTAGKLIEFFRTKINNREKIIA